MDTPFVFSVARALNYFITLAIACATLHFKSISRQAFITKISFLTQLRYLFKGSHGVQGYYNLMRTENACNRQKKESATLYIKYILDKI